ncbi:MAG: NRDE family protein [Desulfomonilaceae bacterium]
MCLILVSFNNHSRYRLILAANRDEFYERPTAPADFWEDDLNVLAGRDLKKGGTWLGVTKQGRIAALTNYRNPSNQKDDAPSRGHLVSDFLKGTDSDPTVYGQKLLKNVHDYNDFNLLFGRPDQVYFLSSQSSSVEILQPGTHGLSNHLLDTPWPKVRTGVKALDHVVSCCEDVSPESVFKILTDTNRPADEFLPDTGIGLEWERILAPIFITSPVYGTRSSTVVMIDFENHVSFVERSYVNQDPNIFTEKTFEFTLDECC